MWKKGAAKDLSLSQAVAGAELAVNCDVPTASPTTSFALLSSSSNLSKSAFIHIQIPKHKEKSKKCAFKLLTFPPGHKNGHRIKEAKLRVQNLISHLNVHAPF